MTDLLCRVAVAVALLVCPRPALAGGLPEGPVRALYGLDRKVGPLRGKSVAGVARWVKRHRFNAVFGGFRDRRLVKALRKQGVKVYAEVPLFVGRKQWRKGGGRPVTAAGKPLPRQGWYAGVCPNQPWLQAARLRQIKRLVQKHAVDGVWLDFVRYPARWETAGKKPLPRTCFCRRCLEQFAKRSGLKYPAAAARPAARARWILSHHRERFVTFKTRRITDFVRRAREVVRGVDPTVVLGLFGVPWTGADHGGAIRSVVGQDFAALSAHVDVFSPMTYHLMVGKNPAWISTYVGYLGKLTGKPVLPVIQACNVPGRMPNKEFTAAVNSARRAPSRGVIVFSYKHFFKQRRASAWLRARP